MIVRSTHRPQLLVDPTVTHVDGNNAHALCQRHFQIVVNPNAAAPVAQGFGLTQRIHGQPHVIHRSSNVLTAHALE
jgi:hypothetical protein